MLVSALGDVDWRSWTWLLCQSVGCLLEAIGLASVSRSESGLLRSALALVSVFGKIATRMLMASADCWSTGIRQSLCVASLALLP